MSGVVNRGSGPNATDADTLYDAFGKINTEFETNIPAALATKVDKIEGKGLSTDDFESDGDYPNLRAGATTKEDVGLANVENLTPEQLRAGVTKQHVGLGNVENLTPVQVREGITKEHVGLGNVENLTPEQVREGITKDHVGLGNVENLTPAQITEGITKEDVGLNNVENLSPEQLRAGVTKEHVGLGNVENLTPEQVREGITKDHVGLGNVQNYPVASIQEAEEATSHERYVTPVRVADYYNKRTSYGTATPDNNSGENGDLYFKYED